MKHFFLFLTILSTVAAYSQTVNISSTSNDTVIYSCMFDTIKITDAAADSIHWHGPSYEPRNTGGDSLLTGKYIFISYYGSGVFAVSTPNNMGSFFTDGTDTLIFYAYIYTGIVVDTVSLELISFNKPEPYIESGWHPTPLCIGDTFLLDATYDAFQIPAIPIYQWLRNGSLIPGYTSDTIFVNTTGSYQVMVTVPGCTTVSPAIVDSFFESPVFPVINSSNNALINCSNQPVILTLNSNYPYYYWLGPGGGMHSTDTVYSSFNYSIRVVDSNGCQAVSLPYSVEFYPPPFNDSICAVTLDTVTNKNLVVWNKTEGVHIESFNIYRDSILIATVPFDSFSTYLDTTSLPSQQYYHYFLTDYDSCGNESSIVSIHQTILLQASFGINNNINLSWSSYQGAYFSEYNIYRSVDGGNYTLLHTVPNTTLTYIDDSVPLGSLQYFVSVSIAGCNPTRAYQTIFSNTLHPSTTGIETLNENIPTIYPNPSAGSFFISGAHGKMKIFNLIGQEVYDGKIAASSERISLNVTSGIYFVHFENNGDIQKLVIK